MATPTTTIDALPAAASITGAQLLVVQEVGVTKRASVDALSTYLNDHVVVNLTAAEISALANPNVAGVDVQAQLTDLAGKVAALDSAVMDTVWAGPAAPVDESIELWWDTDETSGSVLGLASNAETIAGTATDLAVTPAGLAAADAVFNVMTYGAKGDGTTDDTAALQAAINAAVAVCGTVIIPSGEYKFSTVTLGGSVTIRGMGAKVLGQPTFGQAGAWTLPYGMVGSVLRSTATTGKAISNLAGWTNNIVLSDFALIGPGSGTSIGISLGHPDTTNAVKLCRLSNVKVGNFAVGCYFGMENSQTDLLFVQGCLTGIQTGNAHNGNAHNGTNIETCTDYALLLQDADSNMWSGGVFQGNCPGGGTVVATDGGSLNSFHNIYFENAGADYSFDIGHTAGTGDGNTVDNCHIDAANENIRVVTNKNRIVGKTMLASVELNASIGNFLHGEFAGGITGTVLYANFIFDLASTVMLGNQDVRIATGQKLYLETVGGGNYIWRAPTGHTEVNNGGGGGESRLTIGGAPMVAADTNKLGFYGKTPATRPTVPAAATDPATTMALANSLRTALINLGLVT